MTYTLQHRSPYGENGTDILSEFADYSMVLQAVINHADDVVGGFLIPLSTPHAVAGIQADKPLQAWTLNGEDGYLGTLYITQS